MKKQISTIILLGSLWGIVEATIGYLLHLLKLPIGGFLWFPIAFFFLDIAYKKTKNVYALLYTAVLAAGIKFLDFLLPVRADMVINPAVSIVLEAVTVFILYKYILNRLGKVNVDFTKYLIISLGWRMLYICYILYLPEYLIKISPVSSIESFARFFILESIVNTILINIYIRISDKVSEKIKEYSDKLAAFLDSNKVLRPIFATITLAIAAFVQIKV